MWYRAVVKQTGCSQMCFCHNNNCSKIKCFVCFRPLSTYHVYLNTANHSAIHAALFQTAIVFPCFYADDKLLNLGYVNHGCFFTFHFRSDPLSGEAVFFKGSGVLGVCFVEVSL